MSIGESRRPTYIALSAASTVTLDCLQYDNLIVKEPLTGNITIALTGISLIAAGRAAVCRAAGEVMLYLPATSATRNVTFDCGGTDRIQNGPNPFVIAGNASSKTSHPFLYRCIEASDSGIQAVTLTYLGQHISRGAFAS